VKTPTVFKIEGCFALSESTSGNWLCQKISAQASHLRLEIATARHELAANREVC
jgi:hypothetical protein